MLLGRVEPVRVVGSAPEALPDGDAAVGKGEEVVILQASETRKSARGAVDAQKPGTQLFWLIYGPILGYNLYRYGGLR